MFDRFSERARKVMSFARQEAERFNHDYIGTEHMLLGLIKEGGGVGIQVLRKLKIDPELVRREAEKRLKAAPDATTMGQLPFTPRAKKVLVFAIDEMRALDHKYVGTEHLLLGLIREGEGEAGMVLGSLGVKAEAARKAVEELHASGVGEEASSGEIPVEAETEAGGFEIPLEMLNQMGVATPYVFLALLDNPNGFAAQVLTHFGLKLEDVRNEIVRRINAR